MVRSLKVLILPAYSTINLENFHILDCLTKFNFGTVPY